MQRETSAGAVVLHMEKKQQYLLLHYVSGHWDFPKGHVEYGETPDLAARREITEETGIKKITILKGFREKIHYLFTHNKKLVSKDVIFFIATTSTKAVTLSSEHIGFTWLSYDEALERITFKNSKDILIKAHTFLVQQKKEGLRAFIHEKP